KDYLEALERSDFDATTAHYRPLFESELAEARSALDAAAGGGDERVVASASELERTIDGYEEEFARLIALHGRLGHGNQGLEGEIQRNASELERRLVDRGLSRLLAQILAARSAEKNF